MVLKYDHTRYHCMYNTPVFDGLKRMIDIDVNDDEWTEITAVIPPQSTPEFGHMQYCKLCSLSRADRVPITQMNIDFGVQYAPKLYKFSEVNALAKHNCTNAYLLPFALDNTLNDILPGARMNLMDIQMQPLPILTQVCFAFIFSFYIGHVCKGKEYN